MILRPRRRAASVGAALAAARRAPPQIRRARAAGRRASRSAAEKASWRVGDWRGERRSSVAARMGGDGSPEAAHDWRRTQTAPRRRATMVRSRQGASRAPSSSAQLASRDARSHPRNDGVGSVAPRQSAAVRATRDARAVQRCAERSRHIRATALAMARRRARCRQPSDARLAEAATAFRSATVAGRQYALRRRGAAPGFDRHRAATRPTSAANARSAARRAHPTSAGTQATSAPSAPASRERRARLRRRSARARGRRRCRPATAPSATGHGTKDRPQSSSSARSSGSSTRRSRRPARPSARPADRRRRGAVVVRRRRHRAAGRRGR